jgi:hypothetical protein
VVRITKETDMPRLLGSLAALTILAATLFGAALVAPAKAQGLSAGCEFLNESWADSGEVGLYQAATTGAAFEFAGGEQVSVSVAAAPTFGGVPTTITLTIDDPPIVVDTAAFPAGPPFSATVEYTFPAAGTHAVSWFVDLGNVFWTVSCGLAPPPDPVEEIAALQGQVTDLGLAKGLTTALNSKLNAALAALDAEDTAGACGSLQAFLNQVAAQRGKKLTEAQAEQLADAANEIRALLDC